MSRAQVIDQLADLISAIKLPHPVRVAIDGIDAAGKTTLANELVAPIEHRGRQVIRASIDGFHRPRAERYRRGADSPEGYYYDSFNYSALRAALLEPLGPQGNRLYRRAVFDFRTDTAVDAPASHAVANAILLFDGVFLLRPELNASWDYRIFVHADFDVAVARAVQRDQAHGGATDVIAARYWQRYVPGQRIYLQSVRPQEKADVIVENNDPDHPHLACVTMTDSLTLSILPDSFAICRLVPSAPIPSWVTQHVFLSITRTPDELSIVCRQSDVPDGINSERDWCCLKVEGKLDFALTGILASLATLLANAGIPIFAISTFDTDYVLVKASDLKKAIRVLRKAGHQAEETEQ